EEELDDPFLLIDMDKATNRIFKALNNNERICIYGDYDADGVTSTALLYDYLSSLGADVAYYIPSREAEGYGMNNEAIDKIAKAEAKLIITVDNGVSAVNEIAYASSLGIDTVVTDHHTPPEVLPNAVAVVNPHRADCPSEFKLLSGVGVAFKLIMALEDENLDVKSLLNRYSAIASLGTIGDIVSLTGENRILVKNGLENIKRLTNKGITALLDSAGIKGNNKLSAGKISFTVVPRINACGRLALSEKSVELLITDDDNIANQIASELSEDNKIRQDIEKEILDEVLALIESNPHLKYNRVMVVSGEGWHQGVIGIVASRVKEIYGKPIIIITTDGESAKGSGRSVEGFSLIDAITSCKDLLPHFGGHPMAVGLSINTSDIEEFTIRLNQYAIKQGEMPLSTLRIDCKLNPKFLTVELAKQIATLEPFGAGNPTPILGLYNMQLKTITAVGNGNHLRLTLQRDEYTVNAMLFFTTPQQFPYLVGEFLDLAVTIDINEYNNRESLSIIVKDIKSHNADTLIMLRQNELFDRLMSLEKLNKDEAELLLPTRDDFAVVFKFLRTEKVWNYPNYIICTRLNNSRINYGRLQVILNAMHELSLIDYQQSKGSTKISILPTTKKADLNSAKLIKLLQSYTN
ncbi:MAG: single-stranded-DNA-specific exonuclease RecJ, partial [Acutalibacteraceae bacterium]|nr:single-stranded-DNA-specific exonuclease RecJ [Acutalibacteraceae bacterium]